MCVCVCVCVPFFISIARADLLTNEKISAFAREN